VNRISKIINASVEKTGREPSLEEISAESGYRIDFVRNLFTMAIKTYSLESYIDENSKLTLEEVIPNPDNEEPLSILEHTRRMEEVASWLDTLNSDERKGSCLWPPFGRGRTANPGIHREYFGVTRERIRQIEQKALNKLRKIVKRRNIGTESI